jgi:hypothetical protein
MLNDSKKIEEMLTNEEIIKRLAGCKTEEEVRKIFKEENVDLSDEQMEGLKILFSQAAQTSQKTKELSSEELGKASGGVAKEVLSAAFGAVLGAESAFLSRKREDKIIYTVYDVLRKTAIGGLAGVGIAWAADQAHEFFGSR